MDTDHWTKRIQVDDRGEVRFPMQQPIRIQAKNIFVGGMDPDSPVTRRFVEYCVMSSTLCILVRDRRNQQIITRPKEKLLWLRREKRPNNALWNVLFEVDELFFREVEREYDFGTAPIFFFDFRRERYSCPAIANN